MNQKTIIFYTSKGGSTERYARWIAEDCGDIACKYIEEYSHELIEKYDRVIFGSYVKMGKIYLQDFLVTHFNEFSDKELFMFTVGLVPLESESGQRSWNAIPSYIRDVFLCHQKFSGKINIQYITFFDRMCMVFTGRHFHSTFGRREIARFVACVKEDHGLVIAESL